MCFIALHDRSNSFLVMHMHIITNLCAVKRKLHKLDMSCNALKQILDVFTAQSLVIACICITRNKLDVMQFTETHLSCVLFIAQRLVIVCICITRNK